jgi:hypothetical protein
MFVHGSRAKPKSPQTRKQRFFQAVKLWICSKATSLARFAEMTNRESEGTQSWKSTKEIRHRFAGI